MRIVVLFILSKEVSHYHTAGICCVLATIVQVCSFLFNDAVLQILLLLPAAVLAIVGLYQEYEGHIAALYGVNDVLAQKWSALWKRELTFLLLALGGGLFALLIPIIAALAVLVGAIGSFVVSIKRLIYLYQSAKTFREYIQDGAEPYALP